MRDFNLKLFLTHSVFEEHVCNQCFQVLIEHAV